MIQSLNQVYSGFNEVCAKLIPSKQNAQNMKIAFIVLGIIALVAKYVTCTKTSSKLDVEKFAFPLIRANPHLSSFDVCVILIKTTEFQKSDIEQYMNKHHEKWMNMTDFDIFYRFAKDEAIIQLHIKV